MKFCFHITHGPMLPFKYTGRARVSISQARNTAVVLGPVFFMILCAIMLLQVYCCICTGVFFISAAVESVASFYQAQQSDGGGQDQKARLGLDFKLVSMLKLILLAAPLVLQVCLTSWNSCAFSHVFFLSHTIWQAKYHTPDIWLPSHLTVLSLFDR